MGNGGWRRAVGESDDVKRIIRLAVGAVVFGGGVVVLDRLLADRTFLDERTPDGSPIYVVRSLMLLITAAFGLFAVRGIVDRRLEAKPVTEVSASGAATAAGLVVASSLTIVLLVAPSSIGNPAAEDGPIEWLSAVFAFAAAATIGVEALRRRRSATGSDRAAMAVLVLLAMVIALIGLEEVSWFQRVVDFESPGAFQDRNQPELNLHNGATDIFENVYYVGAFVFTVLVPYLLADRRLPLRIRWIESLLPTHLVFYGAAVAAAMAYEMWEIIPIQLAFFITIVALLSDRTPPGDRRLAVSIVAVMAVVQAAFLLWGDGMTRVWDNTELRELVIPYGFLLYGLGLRLDRRPTGARPSTSVERPAAMDA